MTHLAQLNIGRLKAPLDNPSMKEFADFLDPVNRLAEGSDGFIWRFTDDEGTPSSYLHTPFSSDDLLVNFSIWRDLESLKNFTYRTVHSYFLKHRTKWFEKMERHHLVLWWVKEGHIPSLNEAKKRLDHLQAKGPSPYAFDFKHVFSSVDVKDNE